MFFKCWIILGVGLLFVLVNHVEGGVKGGGRRPRKPSCEKITIPFCTGISYNYTKMPNQFSHESQDEAGLEIHQYWPLVELGCSDDLKPFLCLLHVPRCEEGGSKSMLPCRSLCERARAGCEPIMIQYGFNWPEKLGCDQFPIFGGEPICMDEKGGDRPVDNIPISTTNSPSIAEEEAVEVESKSSGARANVIFFQTGILFFSVFVLQF